MSKVYHIPCSDYVQGVYDQHQMLNVGMYIPIIYDQYQCVHISGIIFPYYVGWYYDNNEGMPKGKVIVI